MELTKIKLHSCKEKGKASSQITLDDDYNVPDYRPDIIKVLKESGELKLEEAEPSSGAVWMKGKLVFRVLYRSDQENGKISCLRGELPFQEKINLDGVTEYDPVKTKGEIEDLTIGVIHSRKLSVRAVIVLHAEAEEEKDREICSGISEDCNCEQLRTKTKALQLLFSKRDICRQKSEIVLPSSKPNVQEILWKSIELRNINTHPSTDKIALSGEILVSVLYSEEEETDRIQWYETIFPLDCSVDCDAGELASMEHVVYKVNAEPVSRELEVKPDYDGEERMLVLELVLGLDIRIWKEEDLELLEDLYSLKKQLTPIREEIMLERMLVKNDSQCRLTEHMELKENQEKILQICSCEGTAHLEHVGMQENGVLAEGIFCVELLYVTTDDSMPIGVLKEIYPFEQLVEIPETAENVKVELDCGVNQLSAVMLDQEHVEIKAVIGLNLLAFAEKSFSNIKEVEENEADMEELRKRPGLIGYIAKEGDLLWNIAKENHTTVSEIMKNNQRKDEVLKKGEKILIVKNVQ